MAPRKRSRAAAGTPSADTTAAAEAPPKTLPTNKEELKKFFKDYPEYKIWERRLADPNDPGTLPILLRDDPEKCCGDLGHALKAKSFAKICPVCVHPDSGKRNLPFRRWYVRWGNLGEQERWSTLKSRGYIKTFVKDLRDADEISGLTDAKPEDLVTRGDRRSEVLVRKPFGFFVEEKREQARLRKARMTPKRLKADVVENASSKFGDEAAESIHKSLQIEEVTTHHTTLGEELGSSSE